MTIRFSCPACGHVTQVNDQFAGQSGPCDQCKQQVTIPTVGQAQASGDHVGTVATPPLVSQKTEQSKSGPGCWIAAIVVSVIALAFIIPAILASREANRRMQCAYQMKRLGLGMHNFHDTYKKFPCAVPGEDSRHLPYNWRWALLPFIEQNMLYDQYNHDEPWDSDANLAIAAQLDPWVFQCPSDEPAYKEIKGHMIPVTSYVVIVSDPDGSRDEFSFASKKGGYQTKFSSMVDGTSNILMIVEVKGDDRPAWCEPVDIDFETFISGINAGPGTAGSNHRGGMNVIMCDGSAHFISDSIDLKTLKALATRHGGESLPRDLFNRSRR